MTQVRSQPAYRAWAVPLAVCTGCLVLAALTLLVPSAPTTDPWGWINWGREVVHLELDTDLGGSPAWKPLPVLVTAPLSLAGSAAPTLWVLLARAAGLLGLVVASCVAARLVGDRRGAARWFAGALAAVGLVLSFYWMRAFAHGYSEPLAIALLLGAIDRHLAGRPGQALILGALVSGTRPEAFPLVALYGLVLWRQNEVGLGLVAATLVAVPAAWLIPDWIGSGDPFNGSNLADKVLSRVPQDLGAALSIVPIAYAVAAIVATLHAAKIRDKAYLALALLAGGWAGLLWLMIALGYPPSARFFVLPAAIVCVLGAAGLVRLSAAPQVRWLRAVLAVTVLGLAAWSFGARIQGVLEQGRLAAQRARTESELSRAITLAGGPGLSRCGNSAMPRGFNWLHGVVYWELESELDKAFVVRRGRQTIIRLRQGLPDLVTKGTAVIKVPRKAGVVFLPFAKTRVRFTDRPGRPEPALLATSGHWSVYTTDAARCRRLLAGRAG